MRSRDGLTIGFVGYATIEQADSASLFEDDVLALLPSHGAHVVYRGRRVAEQGAELPLEFHVLWFPSRAALDGYLADPRRHAVIERFGDVFTQKIAVELDDLVSSPDVR